MYCNPVAMLIYGHTMKKIMTEPRMMETLRQAGITQTPQRRAVLKILQTAGQPLSVGVIRERLEKHTRMNKVTVYRIISLFKKQGIIRDVLSAGGAVYVEMATSDHPVHPHFSCKGCGTVACLTPLTFSQARPLMAPRGNFSVEHIEINISGLCNGCLRATRLQNHPGRKRP